MLALSALTLIVGALTFTYGMTVSDGRTVQVGGFLLMLGLGCVVIAALIHTYDRRDD
jgi:hypothetical protein